MNQERKREKGTNVKKVGMLLYLTSVCLQFKLQFCYNLVVVPQQQVRNCGICANNTFYVLHSLVISLLHFTLWQCVNEGKAAFRNMLRC